MPKRFDTEKELAFYRIVQEAITNILRHAQAKKVFVNLVKKGKALLLSVEDDGIGFEASRVMNVEKTKGHTGILVMQERVVQLAGEFSIESRIGGGTHLLAVIPLQAGYWILHPVSRREFIMPRTKILIVDDHQVVIEGLKSALLGSLEFEVADEATNGCQAVERAKDLKPGIVIMDISMPDLNGIEATSRIKAFDPDVRIVVFSIYWDKEYIINLFKAGASAYVMKEESLSELILGINAAARGGTFFSETPSKVLLWHMKDLEEGKES